MKLKNIELQNFKSHEKTQIRPKLITVLIGPNSSGKSSVLQSLMMLKSSLRPPGGSSREAPITKTESFDLGGFEDIVTHNEEKNTFSIKIDGQYLQNEEVISNINPTSDFSYFIEFSENGAKQINLKCSVYGYEIKIQQTFQNEDKVSCKKISTGEEFPTSSTGTSKINPRLQVNLQTPFAQKINS